MRNVHGTNCDISVAYGIRTEPVNNISQTLSGQRYLKPAYILPVHHYPYYYYYHIFVRRGGGVGVIVVVGLRG